MKRVLVVTLSNIGDVILTTPVMSNLAQIYPDAKLTVVVGPKAENLLKGSRLIDRIVVYDKHASLAAKFEMIRELRKHIYETVVDLRNTAIPFLVSTKKRSPLKRHYKETLRRARHLELLKMMGFHIDENLRFDFFREEEQVRMKKLFQEKNILLEKGYVIVAPAAQSELKSWKIEGFRYVLEKLLRETSYSILLLGDQREREIAQPLVSLDPVRIHNLCAETSLKEAAALVSQSKLVLANDSALMHLGFELNRPVVAIFGPTNDEKYGRKGESFRIVREKMDCAPCESAQCWFSRQACFEDLNPEKVLNACQELLHVYSH